MHPTEGFNTEAKPTVWREVSVGGGIYALRESRSTPQKSSLVRLKPLYINLSNVISVYDLVILLTRLYYI